MHISHAHAVITCPPLIHPHGSVEYSSPGPHHSFGTQAIYWISCPEGMTTRGGNVIRMCTSDGCSVVGVWSGAAPVCTGSLILHKIIFIDII